MDSSPYFFVMRSINVYNKTETNPFDLDVSYVTLFIGFGTFCDEPKNVDKFGFYFGFEE